jgi:hypothetical protein
VNRRTAGLTAVFAAFAAVAFVAPSLASAEVAPHVVVDRPVVRFFAPEIGGADQPRFVDERMLAFEARLEVIEERPDGTGEGYEDRQIRSALERHVSEEMLSLLAGKLIAGSPPWQRPAKSELDRIGDLLGATLYERVGGAGRVRAAAAAEGLEPSEVEALLRRQALAAWYIHRAVTPVLEPSEEQLREGFRTSAHPYRGEPFDAVREPFRRWLILERLRAAEGAFFQSARTRMRIVVLR